MKKNIFSGLAIIIFAGFLFMPNISWAASLVPCGSGDTACTLCDLISGFSNLVTYLLNTLVIISLAGLFFSGVMYVVSAGDDGMMKTAKEFATACLKGFVIVLCAWLIINVTFWVISIKSDMGIGKEHWWSFIDCYHPTNPEDDATFSAG